MPFRTAATPRHRGWWNDQINGRIVAVYNGTEIFDFDGNDLQVTQPLTSAGVLTTSDELRVANGFNIRVGTISTFATTQPTNTLVLREGTEAVGAITTAAALSSSATVMRKVIAAGTASNVET